MLRRSSLAGCSLFALLSSLLTGCFSMEMPELEPPSGLEKLVAVSDSTIPVTIDTRGLDQSTLGHQYLLFALPITRIYLPSLKGDLAMELSVACGMRGYRCVTTPPSSTQRTLSISVVDLSVNGYDLLFIRKPTASVTLSGVISQNGQVVRSCEESASATNTAHFAFNAELQHALGEALLQGSYKLLDCLGLTGAQ